jgi:hypothetical protein
MPEVSSPANSDGPQRFGVRKAPPQSTRLSGYSQAIPPLPLTGVKSRQRLVRIDNLTRRSDKAARSRPAFEPGAQDALPEACIAILSAITKVRRKLRRHRARIT